MLVLLANQPAPFSGAAVIDKISPQTLANHLRTTPESMTLCLITYLSTCRMLSRIAGRMIPTHRRDAPVRWTPCDGDIAIVCSLKWSAKEKKDEVEVSDFDFWRYQIEIDD